MRWKVVLAGLALVGAITTGCQRQCFLKECDYDDYRNLGFPRLECDPSIINPPPGTDPRPANILDPDRKVRYITLAEALAIALEQGTTGGVTNLEGISAVASIQDSLVSFQGAGPLGGSDSIRVLALGPAITYSDIETSLSKFDARWVTSMAWNTTDEPAGGNFLTNFSNGTSATFNSALLKPLPTGGVAGITFRTDYTNLTTPPFGFINPQYRPSLQFQFDQPLLQGFGVEINQLRSTLPGLTPGVPGFTGGRGLLPGFPLGGQVEGILITRIRFDQERADFERNLNTLVVNVEVAYWNLYSAYWALYAREQGLRQSFEVWKIIQTQYAAGRATGIDLAQSRAQYESFRSQRFGALGAVLEAERQLRGFLGLPVEDCTRLVPADSPTLAAYQPDWCSALNEALALRPELVIARNDVKFRQLDLINQKNLLMPDLRLTSTYNINGIGTHLDGGANDPGNAFASLASDKFNDWSVGLRMDVPFGFRNAHAAVRVARLRLAQSYALLQDQELKARRFLELQYRHVFENYQQIEAQRATRIYYGQEVATRLQLVAAGRTTLGGTDNPFLLTAIQNWSNALASEYSFIAGYNNTLAGFEYAKGTILQHDNVAIAEGPLPACAQVRAVEHERQRGAALVLRERANPIRQGPSDFAAGQPGLPQLPATAASLPALFAGSKAFSEITDTPPALERMAAAPPTAPPAAQASSAAEAGRTSGGQQPVNEALHQENQAGPDLPLPPVQSTPTQMGPASPGGPELLPGAVLARPTQAGEPPRQEDCEELGVRLYNPHGEVRSAGR
jgi:hypothetical protein